MPAHLSGIQQGQEDRACILDLEQGRGPSGNHSPASSLFKKGGEIQSNEGTCLMAQSQLRAELRLVGAYVISPADGPSGPRL